MIALLLGLSLMSTAAEEFDGPNVDFDFYLKELVSHEMAADAPMAKLIRDYLAEAVFDTTSEKVFRDRLRQIQQSLQENPNRLDRFKSLDSALSRSFEARLESAKQKRLIYTAAGAVVGALVAIPVGRVIGGSTKALLIAIPSGALLGAGAGFLLGQLVAMPHYTYERGMVNRFDLAEVDEFLGAN